MLLVTGEGTVLAGNRAAAEELGCSPETLAGRPLAELAEDPPGEIARYLKDCSRNRQMVLGSLSFTRGGQRIECRTEGAAFRPRLDGAPALVLLRFRPRERTIQQFLVLNQQIEELHREIARRQRIEQELREQREWLRVTLESIGDAVIATDSGAHVTFLNPAAQGLTGWPEAEAVGRPLVEIFHIVNEETREPAENPVARVLREGVTAGLANHTVLITRDGREIPIDDCAAPIRGSDQELAGVVMVFHDIVERRRLERELLQRAERLAEADRRKDEFLAMLAHELRNPLAPIRNSLHLLGMPGVTAATVQRVREMMERQIEHMVRLVDDLLDVSRITRGKIQLRTERLDLKALAVRAAEASRPLLDAQGHSFSLSVPPEPVWVEADPVRLEQVLANLLNNAAKFTENGGHVLLSLSAEGEEAILRVRDTGAGIPPDLLPSIFDPFVQASRALDRSQGGLGIGLTLVRSLVEMHGGRVSAHSEGLGKGSEIVVRLPRLPTLSAEEGSGESTQTYEKGLASSRRVLVVDDNQDSAESIALLAELWGHQTRIAHDGPAALAEALAWRPDVVLLDIGLPGIDGYEVARRLRQEPSLEGVLLAALTGYGQERDRRLSREAGFDVHLVKPVDPETLQALLARSLRPLE